MLSLRLRPLRLSRSLAPALSTMVESAVVRSGVRTLTAPTMSRSLEKLIARQLLLEVVVGEHFVLRVGLDVVGIDRGRRDIGQEIDVRVAEHGRHRQRVGLIGIGAEDLVVEDRLAAPERCGCPVRSAR